MTSPTVGVVVLSYEGKDLTLDCLESLERDGYADRVDIVVDNGSSDGVLEAVATRFPAAERIALPANRGFSAGNNAGIRRALELGCDYVLVLNNDTFVQPGAIRRLVDTARGHPSVGAISPVIVFADDPALVWYGGSEFDPAKGLPARMRGYRRPIKELPVDPYETGRFTGAAVLLPARVITSCGMLDEELFFLCEDVEWSLRIRSAGERILVEPAAHIRHRVARTHGSEHSLASYYYGTRNQLAISEKWHPLTPVPALWRRAVVVAVHVARSRRAKNPLAAIRATFHGLRDAHARRLGPWSRARWSGG